MAVGRLDFGSGEVAEMLIILSQLTWGDKDLPPIEKGAWTPTKDWGADTTEGDTNEVLGG